MEDLFIAPSLRQVVYIFQEERKTAFQQCLSMSLQVAFVVLVWTLLLQKLLNAQFYVIAVKIFNIFERRIFDVRKMLGISLLKFLWSIKLCSFQVTKKIVSQHK